MPKGILLLYGHITQPDHSLRTDQDCKIRLVLENTTRLLFLKASFRSYFMKHLQGKKKTVWKAFFFLQIPSSRKVFPQPCFVPVSPSIHAHLLSALSSFTTTNTLTLFILLGLHSRYLQAGTDWISFGLEFPFHWLHLCQHSRHRSSKELLLRVTEFPHASFLTFRRLPRTPRPPSPALPLSPVTSSRHGSPLASSFRSSSLYTRTSLDEGLKIRKGEMSTCPPGSVGGRERPSPQALRQRDRPGPWRGAATPLRGGRGRFSRPPPPAAPLSAAGRSSSSSICFAASSPPPAPCF